MNDIFQTNGESMLDALKRVKKEKENKVCIYKIDCGENKTHKHI